MQKPNVENNNDFLMTSDVARDCEVSGQTVIVWNRLGKLAAIRLPNGTRLYRRADVERIKAERNKKRA